MSSEVTQTRYGRYAEERGVAPSEYLVWLLDDLRSRVEAEVARARRASDFPVVDYASAPDFRPTTVALGGRDRSATVETFGRKIMLDLDTLDAGLETVTRDVVRWWEALLPWPGRVGLVSLNGRVGPVAMLADPLLRVAVQSHHSGLAVALKVRADQAVVPL